MWKVLHLERHGRRLMWLTVGLYETQEEAQQVAAKYKPEKVRVLYDYMIDA